MCNYGTIEFSRGFFKQFDPCTGEAILLQLVITWLHHVFFTIKELFIEKG